MHNDAFPYRRQLAVVSLLVLTALRSKSVQSFQTASPFKAISNSLDWCSPCGRTGINDRPLVHPFVSEACPLYCRGHLNVTPTRTRTFLHASSTQPTRTASSILLSALPTCDSSISSIVRLAMISSAIGVILQLLFRGLLLRSKDPVWNQNAGYTAHEVVALGLMILVSGIGVVGWYSLGQTGTSADRLLVADPKARWLATVVLGMFVAWDVPSSLLVAKLRKPDVVIHHICMAIIAWIGTFIMPMRYLFYYFGVAELSSIPLVLYSQLNQSYEQCSHDPIRQTRLRKLRDHMGIVVALSFTWVRAIGFTTVTLREFIPDCRSVLSSLVDVTQRRILHGLIGASLAFTALQLFWFSQIVRLALGGSDKVATSDD